MLSFLFWNLNGNNRSDHLEPMQARLKRLAKNYDIDVFAFVEPICDSDTLATLLTRVGVGTYWHSASECQKIQLFTRLPPDSVRPQYDSVDGRLTIRRLEFTARTLLLAVVHLPSQLHHDLADIASHARTIQTDIACVENEQGNFHTVLLGDMNMNPFDHGMVDANSFHGVMTKAVAEPGTRIVHGRTCRFFYNPMWRFFGDGSPGPAGTFYYSNSTPIVYHWNMFDQVLFRAETMHALRELKILDSDGEESLLNLHGRPDTATGSDHLPVLFRLQIEPTENAR